MKVLLSDFIKVYASINRMKRKGYDYTPLKQKLRDMFLYPYKIKPVTAKVIGIFTGCMPFCSTNGKREPLALNPKYFIKKKREYSNYIKNRLDRMSLLYEYGNLRTCRKYGYNLRKRFENYEIDEKEYHEKLENFILEEAVKYEQKSGSNKYR